MKKYISLIVLQIFWTSAAFGFGKPSEDRKDIVTFVFENDIFNNEDDGYTDGLRLSWSSSERNVPKFAERAANKFLPLDNNGKKRVSVAIGQSMFTPRDLSRRDLIIEDRPYAAWLYTSFGMVSDTGTTLDSILLDVGVVGPWAMGKNSQKNVHKITDSPDPKGWSNQIRNEPGVNLTYERKWRNMFEFSPRRFGVDLTPDAGFTVGNIYTHASLGSTLRFGYDLPADYGAPRIRPSLPGSDFFLPTRSLGGYLFAGVQGRAVARNIFLDGNSFRDSHHVRKKPFVGDFQLGMALTYNNVRLSYTQVRLSKEYYGEKHRPRFGSLTCSYRF